MRVRQLSFNFHIAIVSPLRVPSKLTSWFSFCVLAFYWLFPFRMANGMANTISAKSTAPTMGKEQLACLHFLHDGCCPPGMTGINRMNPSAPQLTNALTECASFNCIRSIGHLLWHFISKPCSLVRHTHSLIQCGSITL